MAVMTTLPRSRPFVRADLESMPDDGHRYELNVGVLIVTPAPSYRHQLGVGELHMLLRSACPPDLQVLLAPFDVALDDASVLQPDLLVAPKAHFTRRDLPRSPLLAIEVLSPSTRRIDLSLKRSRYEEAGCPSYWVVDPDAPSATVWELVDGAYAEQQQVVGDAEMAVRLPFALTLHPSALAGEP